MGHVARGPHPLDGRPGLGCVVAPGRSGGQGPPHGGRLHRHREAALPLHTGVVPLARGTPGTSRQSLRGDPHRSLLGGVGTAMLLRRALQGRGRAVPHHAQGADVRADRRHRGRRHHLAARGAGRQPQLGLPLLLVARRHAHTGVADARRLLQRGDGVARLAAARGGGRRHETADHVRARRRTASRGVGGALVARLRGFGPGPDRQRGLGAVPARRVRRGDVGALRVERGPRACTAGRPGPSRPN